MIAPSFLFGFQLGDGDIVYVDQGGVNRILQDDKILGTETHSLSRMDSWKRAITVVRRWDDSMPLPSLFILSTDGFANSYTNEQEFQKACVGYFEMIQKHGAETVDANLKNWLAETSEIGCGDDITLLMAYYFDTADQSAKSASAKVLSAQSPESEVAPNG